MKKVYDFLLLWHVKYTIKKWQVSDWYEEMDKKYSLLRTGEKKK